MCSDIYQASTLCQMHSRCSCEPNKAHALKEPLSQENVPHLADLPLASHVVTQNFLRLSFLTCKMGQRGASGCYED